MKELGFPKLASRLFLRLLFFISIVAKDLSECAVMNSTSALNVGMFIFFNFRIPWKVSASPT